VDNFPPRKGQGVAAIRHGVGTTELYKLGENAKSARSWQGRVQNDYSQLARFIHRELRRNFAGFAANSSDALVGVTKFGPQA
jgi:hypothetical protein